MSQVSFRSKVAFLCSGFVLITSISFLLVFSWNSTTLTQQQIDKRINSGENVLLEYFSAKEKLLNTAAKVLTADFGFKQAVATNDSATITSVLENHSNRINAELMILFDREGDLVSISHSKPLDLDELKKAVSRLAFTGLTAQFLVMNQNLYEVIVLPVEAPRVIGYAIIGFAINEKFISELKRLTALEITFLSNTNEVLISSLDPINRESALSIIEQKVSTWLLFERDLYRNNRINMDENFNVTAVVSASLIETYAEFDRFIISILLIGLLILSSGFVLSRFLAKKLTDPLFSLVKLTKRFANGEYTIYSKINDETIEVKELHESFVSMGKQIKSREQEILYQSRHDLLTGLYNRQTLTNALSKLLNTNEKVLLIAINIRNFRSINDVLGAAIGDLCIKGIAVRIENFINGSIAEPTHSVYGRLGADEFLIGLKIASVNNKNSESMKECIVDVMERLSQSLGVEEMQINLKFRIGVCLAPENGNNAHDLLRRVNIAIDTARRENEAVRYYKNGEDEAHLERLLIVDELKDALHQDDGQLYINYQPKLNLITQRIDKVEALIRWKKKNGQFIPPDYFIDLAERSGLIIELTHWVICAILKQLVNWKEHNINLKIAINVSSQDLSHPSFLDFLLQKLDEYKVSTEQITLEITERDIMENEDLIISRLIQLNEMGIATSIDDYGIGQSSLSKLKQLPIKEIKIDKSFIMKLDEDKKDQFIVGSTINLGHQLGLSVVAEGVENEQSLDILRSYKCDYIQGYYISRPTSADELVNWIKDNDY